MVIVKEGEFRSEVEMKEGLIRQRVGAGLGWGTRLAMRLATYIIIHNKYSTAVLVICLFTGVRCTKLYITPTQHPFPGFYNSNKSWV